MSHPPRDTDYLGLAVQQADMMHAHAHFSNVAAESGRPGQGGSGEAGCEVWGVSLRSMPVNPPATAPTLSPLHCRTLLKPPCYCHIRLEAPCYCRTHQEHPATAAPALSPPATTIPSLSPPATATLTLTPCYCRTHPGPPCYCHAHPESPAASAAPTTSPLLLPHSL